MTFLAPGFLWTAPAALIPLALHYWGRRGAPRRPFSDVALLRAAAGSWYHPDRWRDPFLLLIRTAMIAALILFFAGPVWRPAAGAAAGGGRSLILLDASYSMGAVEVGRTAFDAARARALEILDGLPPGESAGAIVFSDRVENAAEPALDRTPARRLLERARPTHRPTDLRAALAAVQKESAEAPGPWTVYLVSDLAAHGWRSAPPAGLPALDVRWALCETGTDYSNGALFRAWSDWDPSTGRVRGNLELRSWGPAGKPERGWSVTVADGPAVLGRAALLGGRGEAVFASPSVRLPVLNVVARLEPDALPEDDVYYAAVPRRNPPSFLIVNGAPNLSPVSDEAHYLQPVLDAWERDGARVRTVWPGEISAETLTGTDAVALLNVGTLTAKASAALEAFVRQGGGLWMTAGDQWSESSVPSFAPFHATAATDVEDVAAPGPAAGAFGIFGERRDVDWSSVRVQRLGGLLPGPGASVWLRGRSSGRPLLVSGKVGGGRVAAWMASIDRDWTNAPASPLYPILCRDVLAFLSRADAAPPSDPEIVGGAWVGRRPGASTAVLRRPDGSVDRFTGRGGEFRVEPLDAPGFYRLDFSSGEETVFAVNASRADEEGNPARVSPDTVGRWLGRGRFVWIGPNDDWARKLAGRPLRPALIQGLLVLFALETLLLVPRGAR